MKADTWFLGLKALISRCRELGHSENRRGAQSCVNSPSSFLRRKCNMGLSKETTKMSQVFIVVDNFFVFYKTCKPFVVNNVNFYILKVRSVCGSPIPESISDRCFSDALSYSSDSFYSRSSISSTQNFTENLPPYSPCMKSEEPKKNKNPKAVSRFSTQATLEVQPNPKRTKLSHVLIWGEGVENGVLGGGENMVNSVKSHQKVQNQTQMDALLPKVLDSVGMHCLG